MAITKDQLALTREFLSQYTASPTTRSLMDEAAYVVAFRFGSITRRRAERLVVAARQDMTTTDVRRGRKR